MAANTDIEHMNDQKPKHLMTASIAVFTLFALVGCAPVMSGSGYIPCPTPPQTSDLGKPLPETDPETTEKAVQVLDDYATQLIGYAEANAEACVIDAGLTWRVLERDGQFFPATLDYRFDRVNVAITNGFVVNTNIG